MDPHPEFAILTDDGLPTDAAAAHTEMKLSVLSRYIGHLDRRGRGGGFLQATRTAYRRRYIDAFAGVGRYDFGHGHLRDGSALMALRRELPGDPPIAFTHIGMIELDEERFGILSQRVAATGRAADRATLRQGDANRVLREFLEQVEDRTPTIVLLDPYDLDDLQFETVRLVGTWHAGARQNRVEQLVGLQIGRIRRQASRDDERMPSDETLAALEQLLGNDRWRPVMEDWVRHGGTEWPTVFAAMRDSFEEELRKIGYKHVRHCDVDERDPIYSLVFASDNDQADAIMDASIQHWLRDPERRQRALF